MCPFDYLTTWLNDCWLDRFTETMCFTCSPP